MTSLNICLAQINCLVGDAECNAGRILASTSRARDDLHADLVVFPELALTGYPPEDLLLRPGFIENTRQALQALSQEVRGVDVVVGSAVLDAGKLYNSALHLRDGGVVARYDKHLLPNYSVFDEKRYFEPGEQACVVTVKGVPIGLTVCEDIWEAGPARKSLAAGARLLININASPYHLNKHQEREQVLRARVQETGLAVVYVNLIGGQDELVFDGESMVMNAAGQLAFRAPAFEEALSLISFSLPTLEPIVERAVHASFSEEQSVYEALKLGIRDYVSKNGFNGAVIGLSGGIDSALTLALAVDALGAENVEAVMMPSRYTAAMSLEDARSEAQALSAGYREIGIESVFSAFLDSLAPSFAGLAPDITEENIQARCRGVLLMALSNKQRRIVLTTGNKSEMAVGYATLYGDMAGGFAPLKDLYKHWVYRLARYRNTVSQVIPERVLERPPTAELRADQKDSDSLPPYDVLDPVLELLIEHDLSIEDIVARGFDRSVVAKVARLLLASEYKRRQAPPGVRITRRAFGKDRRYPVTSGYGRVL
jgi:NAD+ synthase (glutamine-hydrolysing)